MYKRYMITFSWIFSDIHQKNYVSISWEKIFRGYKSQILLVNTTIVCLQQLLWCVYYQKTQQFSIKEVQYKQAKATANTILSIKVIKLLMRKIQILFYILRHTHYLILKYQTFIYYCQLILSFNYQHLSYFSVRLFIITKIPHTKNVQGIVRRNAHSQSINPNKIFYLTTKLFIKTRLKQGAIKSSLCQVFFCTKLTHSLTQNQILRYYD
eukprot:TRINITY_DN3859_c0_g1_i2.p2 TRINITY_DN3859_c0_g1~~TRINITY_DN3859_c0_g1_i2.p2  ORF type:complete len:210 (+),score=-27.07 TRINITY_DN3859_c0_g1_i2:1256-1885(+)